MRYPFTKMQSLGNDFIVLDGVSEKLNVTPDIARRLADRHFGVGCDQVLLVEPAAGAAGEFVLRIFNHDGSEAEHCGNGARCLAQFLHDGGLAAGKVIRAHTTKVALTLTINPDASITVEMGTPQFAPAAIPFLAERAAPVYALDLNGERVEISALAIGNPHAVRRVEDVARAPVATQGLLVENHPRFPARVNAGFMQVVARDHIRLRVHERGVGETLGCGSGACAAVAVGIELGLLDRRVRVSLPGGDAEVDWQGRGHPIFLTGPAHTVFRGDIEW